MAQCGVCKSPACPVAAGIREAMSATVPGMIVPGSVVDAGYLDPPPAGGYRLVVVGKAQAMRMRLHFGCPGLPMGRGRFGFYVAR